ncbi:DUF4124 domain-containing protein [Alginatibacterium sediminis]|uniref:DUF4124 domain-containing protein n=1 Tax=Alginatibacterium sediminis TaxID=2164068 RepID=A0A420ENG4_9ALTE|nr:DUF4124 domain-containing protein [Alginatibacterium sediminis]RKF22201.1 DUF4124 domain-containing protein [Alginatibacterium sediminis]
MKAKKIFLVISLMMLSAQSFADKVYTWTDESGVTHYSDKAQSGAKQIKVSVAPPASQGPIVEARAPLKKAEDLKQNNNYKLSFVSPQDEGSVRNNEGIMNVSVSSNQAPSAEHGYRIVLDGVPQGSIQAQPQFVLHNVDRGEHQLQVQLVDRAGKEIASTPTITVFLHRTGTSQPVATPFAG